MFGRATITLGIGPHSSLQLVRKQLVSAVCDKLTWCSAVTWCCLELWIHGTRITWESRWRHGKGHFWGLVSSAKFTQNMAFFQKIRREILHFSREICCALSTTRQTVYAKFLCDQPIYLAKTASSMSQRNDEPLKLLLCNFCLLGLKSTNRPKEYNFTTFPGS